jgi:nucleotide-binding universal stress UspA family protein
MTRPVIVCPDRSAAGRRALRWAAGAARRRGAALHIVIPDGPDQQDPRSSATRRAGFAAALSTLRAAAPGIPVLGGTPRARTQDVLRERSAEAATLVVPTTLPDAARVIADSYCPVVVVPGDGPAPEAEQGPVVLAVAPWTGEDVIALAFAEASGQRAPLLALCAWSEPGIDLGRPRADRIAEWDRSEERVRQELEFTLSPWRVVHPDVDVQVVAVEDRAAELLLAFSHRARLVVVGRSERGALLGGLSESPVAALLRAARCPVLVVPAEGPPRSTWLPSPARGWALTAR